jgi:hypothetical protein
VLVGSERPQLFRSENEPRLVQDDVEVRHCYASRDEQETEERDGHVEDLDAVFLDEDGVRWEAARDEARGDVGEELVAGLCWVDTYRVSDEEEQIVPAKVLDWLRNEQEEKIGEPGRQREGPQEWSTSL